jgi:hypothetical protein
MTVKFYGATALTGGGTGAVDKINGSKLNDGDMCIVYQSSGLNYVFVLDADSAAAESSPTIISPDRNAGDKRWVQCGFFSTRSTATQWTGQQNFAEATLTSSSNSVAWDLDTAQMAYHNLTENTTIAEPSNMVAGGTYALRIEGDGSSTLSWNAVFEWGENSAPSAPSADGDILICSFYSDGSTMYGGKFCLVEA